MSKVKVRALRPFSGQMGSMAKGETRPLAAAVVAELEALGLVERIDAVKSKRD